MYQQFNPKRHGFLLRLSKYLTPTSHFHSLSKNPTPNSKLGFVLKEVEELQSLKPQQESDGEGREVEEHNGAVRSSGIEDSKVQISHPWPEWIDLMELLLKKGLFQEGGGGGGGHPFGGEALGPKDSNRIRTACLNFARERSELVRYFSRKDIRVVMESGCPSIDRKVVNSGKRLRAHVGMDEGKVCSICSLRGSCERAYVKAREDEDGRTIDVMRILLTYGLDPITGSVENKPSLDRQVKESVRKLLSEMVELSNRENYSDSPKLASLRRLPHKPEYTPPQQIRQIDVPMKQGDWICPKCDFINFARNIKCLRCDGFFQERLRKFREDQDHLPLKKGDWLCDKCNFLNFAKNTRCLQCEEKPPKRQLNPGEWECESCNYINFRKNMVCLKCDWKRPKASNYSDTSAQNQEKVGPAHQPHGFNFVRNDDEERDRPSIRQETQSCNKGAGSFKFIQEEDIDDVVDDQRQWNRFVDFPILGGKSDVSKNSQIRERWKTDMAKKSRNACREKEENDISHSQLPRYFESLESTEEELAGWFGYRTKSETEN